MVLPYLVQEAVTLLVVTKERQVLKELSEHKGHRGRLDFKVLRELLVLKEPQVLKERQEHKV
jgi:hypothetical protein